MNTVSKILLGGLILAVCVCVWYLLTQKNAGSCGGSCNRCTQQCDRRENQEK